MAKQKVEQLFRVALRGEAIMHSPRWNKGSAFTHDERRAFGLVGRLPSQINDLDAQCKRAYDQMQGHSSALGKNTFLQSIRDQVGVTSMFYGKTLANIQIQSWVLYYSLLRRHLTEMMPIIYTPTEVSLYSYHKSQFDCVWIG